ncbi:response regulator [Pseudomonas entomophila]|uniref:response regulator n=1 Tax=Pseudomonas entomophila TaxID=312306 RepID=UPI0015E336F5|nr:response regulator [Pseudomonas entomophila]MBA1191038.1 response regulator [Pseudomonas entomophila]
MNLDFGILWIEDSFSLEEKENLKRRVKEAGFIARIRTIPNSQGIDDLAYSHSLYHDYDIILLDYRLEDSENGADIAPRIRELFPSTTILFYSGSLDEAELRRLMADKVVEGVYCSARRRFIERTGSLIDQTARSLDRLSGMRGLAMRVVAECDAIMKEAVLAISEKDPDGENSLRSLDEEVIKYLNSSISKYQESQAHDLSARLDTRAVDSAKLFGHFRRSIKAVTKSPNDFGIRDTDLDRLRELRALTSRYAEEVLAKRNILGHVVEIQSAQGWTLSGRDDISASDFPDIRRSFALYIDAIRGINEIVTRPHK